MFDQQVFTQEKSRLDPNLWLFAKVKENLLSPSRIAQAGKLTLHKLYRGDQDKLTVKLCGSGLENLAERGQLLPNTLLVLSPDSRPQRGFRQLRAATRPAATQSRRVACNNRSPHYSTIHNVQGTTV